MRGVQYAWMIWVLCLPASILATTPLPLVLVKHKGTLGLRAAQRLDLPAIQSRSTSSTTAPSQVSSKSSNLTSPTSTSHSELGIDSDASAMSDANSSSMSTRQRNLIIILTTVLGSVGIMSLAVAICLICRYKRGKTPFRNRGVTPIDDEEIETWREPKQSPTMGASSPHTPRGMSIDSIALKHSPQLAWVHSPNSMQYPPPALVAQTPDFIARAPNSRVGLTDEAIPGAAPFITPPKRQSSRLSKAPPGHSRTKSRRSSISAKSVRSFTGGTIVGPIITTRIPTWYDPDDSSVGMDRRDTDHSSPGTSIFDGLSAGGGLSPRPKSKTQLRPWDPDYAWDKEIGGIGRAIA
ncbi:hypothetical protein B0O99DRAFT_689541 [Bisporella sp. PMI_857]|nr:hypothetical protein B0O99DRAFT_689541 [Bisporella sp. PMI_857]